MKTPDVSRTQFKSKDPSLLPLEKRVDQLRSRAPASRELVDAMTDLASQLWFEPDCASPLVEEAMLVADEIGYRRGRARALVILAASHYISVRFKEALPLLLEAMPVLIETGDQRSYAYGMLTMSGTTQNVGGYDEAIGYAFKAIEAAKESEYIEVEGWGHLRLSSTYQDLGDFERSLEHAERCAEVFDHLYPKTRRRQHGIGVARAQTQLGAAKLGLDRTEEALEHTRRALEMYREFKEVLGQTRALTDIGTIYQRMGDLETAEEFLLQSLRIRRKIGHVSSQTTSLIALGKLELERGELAKAREYFSEALKIADEAQLKMRASQAHEALGRVFEADEDFEPALAHYRAFQEAKDKLAGEAMNLRIHNLQVLAKIDQAEKEAMLERERSAELEKKNEELARLLAELKATQDRLVHSEKMASLGQLTAGIAHEIKNPLNFVNNFAHLSIELMDELLVDIEERRRDLPGDFAEDLDAILADLRMNATKIHEHGVRADSIVRSMLDHSRSGPGHEQEVDLNAFLEEFVNLAWHGAKASDAAFQVDVERDYDEGVGKVTILTQDMGRTFINLLNNAFHAVREQADSEGDSFHGQITVKTSRSTRPTEGNDPDSDTVGPSFVGVEIRISDNGPGIPKELSSKIFEPFFTTKASGTGTGLGLSMSYDIVTKGHGGSLDVESVEGEGATFVIRLPDPEE